MKEECPYCDGTGEYEVVGHPEDGSHSLGMRICEYCCEHAQLEQGHCINCGIHT